jgi:hypothetical protein
MAIKAKPCKVKNPPHQLGRISKTACGREDGFKFPITARAFQESVFDVIAQSRHHIEKNRLQFF